MFKANKFGRKYWHIFLAANLWSIWLARNACVFQRIRKTPEELAYMLKFYSYEWINARGWFKVTSTCTENIRIHNPWGFINLQIINRKDWLMNILALRFDFVSHTDGSWIMQSNGDCKAGIGGVTFNNQRKVVFFFSGPSRGHPQLIILLRQK